jgi:hypothetical protein
MDVKQIAAGLGAAILALAFLFFTAPAQPAPATGANATIIAEEPPIEELIVDKPIIVEAIKGCAVQYALAPTDTKTAYTTTRTDKELRFRNITQSVMLPSGKTFTFTELEGYQANLTVKLAVKEVPCLSTTTTDSKNISTTTLKAYSEDVVMIDVVK